MLNIYVIQIYPLGKPFNKQLVNILHQKDCKISRENLMHRLFFSRLKFLTFELNLVARRPAATHGTVAAGYFIAQFCRRHLSCLKMHSYYAYIIQILLSHNKCSQVLLMQYFKTPAWLVKFFVQLSRCQCAHTRQLQMNYYA